MTPQLKLEIAIHAALAALERPTHGDRETYLDNVAEAKEILKGIVIQQQLEAPERSEDFETIIEDAWIDGYFEGYAGEYFGPTRGWKRSDTYKSLKTKNKVKP